MAVGSYGTYEYKKDSFEIGSEINDIKSFGNSAYTVEQVVSLWGEPDEISINGSCDVLTYYDGYNWSGVGAFVLFFPVPLLVPSGHSKTKIYFKNSQSIKLTSEYGKEVSIFGYTCGSDKCGFSTGAVNPDQPRKVLITWCD